MAVCVKEKTISRTVLQRCMAFDPTAVPTFKMMMMIYFRTRSSPKNTPCTGMEYER